MKPIRVSSTQHATPSGPRSIRTPRASSTSALPQALLAARLPCFATRPPAAATTSELTVEMLKLLERSPPVPTMSIASAGTVTRTATSRSADAQPAISSTVSPRMCSTASSAPSCAGVASPAITDAMAERASSRVSVRPAATAPSASRASNEVLQHPHPVGGHHRFRVELHRLERKRQMPKRHDDPVIAAGCDDEVRRERFLVDHQGVVPRRLGGLGDPREDSLAVVPHERGLSMARLGSTHHRRPERDRRALQSEAYPERRNPPLRALSHELGRAAGGLGSPWPGRDDQSVWAGVERRGERRIVGAKHRHLRAERTERLREVVGERVVVIDEQDLDRHRRASAPSTSSTARRSARAFARVSSSSAAGSESATIPAPASMRQTPSAITAVRMPMHVSIRPSNPRYPTAPAYGPRRPASSPATASMARTSGPRAPFP